MFETWFRLRPACPACGHRFDAAPDDAMLGPFTVNLGITLGVLLAGVLAYVVALAAGAEAPGWPVLGGAAVAVGILPVVAYPFSQTVWHAIEIALHHLGER